MKSQAAVYMAGKRTKGAGEIGLPSRLGLAAFGSSAWRLAALDTSSPRHVAQVHVPPPGT